MGVQSQKKPSFIRPLPLVNDVNGEPLTDFASVAERWRSYFAEQEDGVSILAADLFASGRWVPPNDDELPEWTDIPSLCAA